MKRRVILQKFADVSEQLTGSTIRAMRTLSEDGGIMFLRNCGTYLHAHKVSTKKTNIDIFESVKGKGKVVPLRSIEALLGERRYSSYSLLTPTLEGGEWSASRPGRALPPVPIV
jgi:hypothetical protein